MPFVRIFEIIATFVKSIGNDQQYHHHTEDSDIYYKNENSTYCSMPISNVRIVSLLFI
jgi:hypothetical protein